jgi:hypothetical protein
MVVDIDRVSDGGFVVGRDLVEQFAGFLASQM